jgi:hypothetical protein
MMAAVSIVMEMAFQGSPGSEGATQIDAWLSFASTLIWQALIIIFVLAFRQQFAELLGRLSRIKVGSFEGELLQSSEPDAPTPTAEPPSLDAPAPSPVPPPPYAEEGEIEHTMETAIPAAGDSGRAQAAARVSGASEVVHLVAPGGFLTEHGIRHVLETSGLLAPGEVIREHLLLFRTKTQRTWLVGTTASIYCLLDDENTRAKGRVVQWQQPVQAAKEVYARPKSKAKIAGVVDIGRRRNWLYSLSLHPDPQQLEHRIQQLAGVS